MHDLVIARYNEPLEWIVLVPQGFRIHVYNKGAPINSGPVRARVERITDCRNEGRESETYLTHLIEHGAGAGEFTVFCQGDPFEHSPDFLDLLETTSEWQDIQPLSWCWKEGENIPTAGAAGHWGWECRRGPSDSAGAVFNGDLESGSVH